RLRVRCGYRTCEPATGGLTSAGRRTIVPDRPGAPGTLPGPPGTRAVRRGSDRASHVLVVGETAGRRLLDVEQELDVGLRLLELAEQQLDRLLLVERAHDATELVDDLQLVVRHEDLLAARAGRVDVHGREDALVGEVPGQAELHVPRALELLEDDLVHLGAGLDERRGEDRQGAAVLDVARRAEEPLGRVERRGVHTTGQDAARGRRREVVGARQAGQRVEQHDDVLTELDQALRALDRELGDDRVVRGGAVERRGD